MKLDPTEKKVQTTPRKKGAPRVMLVDDHAILRQGLAQLLSQDQEFLVCGQFEDANSALLAIPEAKPDLVIVDLTLKEGNGLELIKSIRAAHAELCILVLSMHDEMVYAERALRAGASGYVMKQEEPGQLLAALRRVLNGEVALSEKVNARLMQQLVGTQRRQSGPALERLSDRELEVFTLIGDGLGTRQIAAQLHLSVKTVESHRAHIKQKLDLKTSSELVHRAIQLRET
jgi:DNA-binding NarL/FixJ family response regulator